MGLALVDINKLNANGPNHEYRLGDFRTYLWQPVWLDVALRPEAADELPRLDPDEVIEGGTNE